MLDIHGFLILLDNQGFLILLHNGGFLILLDIHGLLILLDVQGFLILLICFYGLGGNLQASGGNLLAPVAAKSFTWRRKSGEDRDGRGSEECVGSEEERGLSYYSTLYQSIITAYI